MYEIIERIRSYNYKKFIFPAFLICIYIFGFIYLDNKIYLILRTTYCFEIAKKYEFFLFFLHFTNVDFSKKIFYTKTIFGKL